MLLMRLKQVVNSHSASRMLQSRSMLAQAAACMQSQCHGDARFEMHALNFDAQVSEAELEAIARGGGDAGMDVDVDGAGGEATRRLLGDYATPARWALFAVALCILRPRRQRACARRTQLPICPAYTCWVPASFLLRLRMER
jgi:hypothetical protein